ncbi:MAG TPA: DUF4373 domain-containing protein [Spirochaetia bacterium]|nr:DUF4373 domain-containing protein [Spirochaetales bacterium]HRY79219.1 DUF4373 domain-containing protein [Spirochaetia bacterium]HRZ88160.1 DUF4373 domain-containing protein [Spirochaetia bacterium]
MKNNIPYFQHRTDSHSDYRHKIILGLFGMEGIGAYWTLLEIIGNAPDCRIKYSDIGVQGSLAYELGMHKPQGRFQGFIDTLVQYELIVLSEGYLTSLELQETLEYVSRKRIRNHQQYIQRKGSAVDSSDSTTKTDNSAAETDNSASPNHTIRTGTGTGTGNKQERAARVELSPGEEEALRAFALGWAKKQRGIGNPEGFARKRWQDSDVVAAWRKSLEPPPPPVEPIPPATPDEIAAANEEADRIMREAMARPGLGQALSGAVGAV